MRYRSLVLILALLFSALSVMTPPPPAAAAAGPYTLKASDNGRFLVKPDGAPFFYLADTAWELFHRQNRPDVDTYLTDRAEKGFTVIQAVGLAELDGVHTPNAYGHLPLNNANPASPRVVDGPENDYWDHVDYIVDKAASLGMYMGFLPTWGSHVNDSGKVIFDAGNAYEYGRFLGARYKDKPVIWILGGDRPADTSARKAVWRAMAKGIAVGAAGSEDYSQVAMTYHSWAETSSSAWFHTEPWLDFNAIQSGAKRWNNPCLYECPARDYNLTPVKPTVDIEVNYDDSVVNWDPDQCCYTDYDVRKGSYWSVFAGGHGITYGTRNIWQFWTPDRRPVSYPQKYWYDSLDLPGAYHVALLKSLMLSRPFLTRVPAQGLLSSAAGSGGSRVQATKNADGAYGFVYVPNANQSVTVDLTQLSGGTVNGWWYNPRDGKVYKPDGTATTTPFGQFPTTGTRQFTTPSSGPDWVLVLDDATKNFSIPGTGTTQPPVPPQPTTLRNAGFEDATIAPWTAGPVGTQATDQKHSGAKSFNMWSASAYTTHLEQAIDGQAAGSYTARMWIRSGGTHSTLRFVVSVNGTVRGQATPAVNAAWTQYTVPNITVAAGDTVRLRVDVAASGGAWSYVDDFELTRQ